MSEPFQELSWSDYWRAVRRRKWVVLTAVGACVTGALAMTALQTPVYESEARMTVRSVPGGSIFGSDYLGNVDRKRTVATEVEVLQSNLVLKQLKRNLGLVADPPRVKGTVVGATDVIAVTVRSGSAVTAQTLADAFVQAYIDVKQTQAARGLAEASAELESQIADLESQVRAIDEQVDTAALDQRDLVERRLSIERESLANQLASLNQRLNQMQIDAALLSGGAELIEPALLPVTPVEPTPIRTAFLALLLGLLLGLGAAFVVDFSSREDS